MKTNVVISLILPLLFLAFGCDKELCRDCPAFNYNTSNFAPDYPAENLSFIDTAGVTVTFNRLRTDASQASQECREDVVSERDISCTGLSEAEYRSAELGVDMVLSYATSERLTGNQGQQVVLFYSFKGVNEGSYTQTHALIIEPSLIVDDAAVFTRDSLPFANTTLLDVIELRQDSALLRDIGTIPEAGKFPRIIMRDGDGLLGFRDITGKEYLKID